jgi:hypothetical protein
MRRREFIAGLGSTAAWPVVARAQEPMPLVGFLYLQQFPVDLNQDGSVGPGEALWH